MSKVSLVNEQDLPDITHGLVLGDISSVLNFGSDIEKIKDDSDVDILSEVRSSDMDDLGKKLIEIIRLTQSGNDTGFINSLAKTAFGKFLPGIKVKIEEKVANFKSVRDQLNTLTKEVQKMIVSTEEELVILSAKKDYLKEKCAFTEKHISIAKKGLEDADKDLLSLRENVEGDDFRLIELERYRDALDKKIHDLILRLQSNQYRISSIMNIEGQNISLLDSYQVAIHQIIPSWEDDIELYRINMNQSKGNAITALIHDVSNSLLVGNATKMKENALATERSNQRSILDLKTISAIRKASKETIDGVRAIQKEGKIARATLSYEVLERISDNGATKAIKDEA